MLLLEMCGTPCLRSFLQRGFVLAIPFWRAHVAYIRSFIISKTSILDTLFTAVKGIIDGVLDINGNEGTLILERSGESKMHLILRRFVEGLCLEQRTTAVVCRKKHATG